MDLVLLKKIMKMVDDSTINDFELETEGIKIKLSKAARSSNTPYPVPMYPPMPNSFQQAPVAAVASDDSYAESDEALQDGYYEIKSPIVGTFYKAPSPESSSFVEVGSRVAPGTTLCIVEAMKLMNEIESDVSGEIIKILAENGKPVEYNQPLFLIKLD